MTEKNGLFLVCSKKHGDFAVLAGDETQAASAFFTALREDAKSRGLSEASTHIDVLQLAKPGSFETDMPPNKALKLPLKWDV
jgi:hypothetical protein